MSYLFEYVIPVRRSTRAQFVTANPRPFLLLNEGDENDQQAWTFKTKTVSVTTARVTQLAHEEDLELAPELARYQVFVVAKSSDNSWPEHISVGRARNNDVVLGDTSVSKLHAHFRFDKKGKMFLEDAGSRNGTRVNDRRIEAGDSMAVEVGDTITFGRSSVTLLCAGDLFDLVTRLVREANTP